MLPDLTGFVNLGTEYKNDQDCQKWQKKDVVGEKVEDLPIYNLAVYLSSRFVLISYLFLL